MTLKSVNSKNRTAHVKHDGHGINIVIEDDGDGEHMPRGITVKPEDLARELNALGVEGFNVTYAEPVKVPTGIGAVVRNRNGSTYVHLSHGWVGAVTHSAIINATPFIHDVLSNGGTVLSEGVEA